VAEERYDEAERLKQIMKDVGKPPDSQMEKKLSNLAGLKKEDDDTIKPYSDTTTNGVRVRVDSFYIADQSAPADGRFLFGYNVTVTNCSLPSARDRAASMFALCPLRGWHLSPPTQDCFIFSFVCICFFVCVRLCDRAFVRLSLANFEHPKMPRCLTCAPFACRIIAVGDKPVQLIARTWLIRTESSNRVEEVSGSGVVGRQPVLEHGEAFRYASACPLNVAMSYMNDLPSSRVLGSMEGSYTMVSGALGQDAFKARINPFCFVLPGEWITQIARE